ncbi:hypothetical protein [Arthrobacter sp. zg-Y1143]|nr:hypothetical protein [Arthrobacter sp. zg-Y1143]MDK1327161.1 hypothetical protein [Arthrobacter sp. zg-Y1143]
MPPGAYMPPPKPGIVPLRRLGVGEILDGAFRACRRSAAATFGSALLIQAFIALVTVILGFIFGDQIVIDPVTGDLSDAGMSDDEVLGSTLSILSLFGWVALGNTAGALLIQGLMVIPVARAVLNLKTGFGQTWRILGPVLLRLAGLILLLMAAFLAVFTLLVLLFSLVIYMLGDAGIVVTVLGSLASIALLAWVSVKLMVAPAVLVLEGTGVFRSLARAWQVTRTNWWRVFGVLLLTGLITSVLMQVLSVPLGLITSLSLGADPANSGTFALLMTALSLLVAGIAYTFQGAVTALLYVDLRMRREGFDIALMREQENPRIQDPDFLPGRAAPAAPGGTYPGPGMP